MSNPTPSIAIIGAGPVGCMLARLLHQAGIECTVFESEESIDFRSQGGTLDLHEGTGLAAMKAAGLFEEFQRLARYDAEALKLTDKKLNIIMQVEAPGKDGPKVGGSKPEIDRSQLRQLLSQSLPDGTIRWGHRLKRVDEDGQLVFANGFKATFDLVVGADGAWSVVRQTLSKQKPYYSGLSMYELVIPNPEIKTPELYKLVNRGSLFTYSEDRDLVIQLVGSGELNLYAIFKTYENWIEEQRRNPPSLDQVKETLVGEKGIYSDHHPILQDGLAKCEGSYTPRPLYMLPVGFRWKHRRGFTLVGDAAHVMTPFAGEGVNVGLKDALELSDAIVAAVKAGGATPLDAVSLDHAVDKYETAMGPRVDQYTGLTQDMLNIWFYTPGTPQQKIGTFISKHVCFHLPWLVRPFASFGIRGYFALKNALAGMFGWSS